MHIYYNVNGEFGRVRMREMASDLYRVMGVFDDITVNQCVGKWPKVDDFVRVIARSANRKAVYAKNNGAVAVRCASVSRSPTSFTPETSSEKESLV